MIESAAQETTESAYGESSAQRRYWTPLIADRRKRILIETRSLLTEVGADEFTLRDLGQRSVLVQDIDRDLVRGLSWIRVRLAHV